MEYYNIYCAILTRQADKDHSPIDTNADTTIVTCPNIGQEEMI